MMAPSIVMREGEVELVLGSAGSNRIRSALLQTIVGVVDRGLGARGRGATRRGCTSRTASSTPSRGSTSTCCARRDRARVVALPWLNLFFGGVQAVLSADAAPDRRRRSRARRRGGGGMRRRCWRSRLLAVRARPAAAGRSKRPTCSSSSAAAACPGASLTLLVNEEGGVNVQRQRGAEADCKLSDPQLIEARAHPGRTPANRRRAHLRSRRGPARCSAITLRDENGSVRFADNSAGQPTVLHKLALFVLQVAQQVCHLPI